MCMLKDAPGSADKAYDFLNAVNDPERRQLPASRTGATAMPTPRAWQRSIRRCWQEKGYADVEKFVDKTLFQSPVPTELKQKMIAEFEKIKAGY